MNNTTANNRLIRVGSKRQLPKPEPRAPPTPAATTEIRATVGNG